MCVDIYVFRSLGLRRVVCQYFACAFVPLDLCVLTADETTNQNCRQDDGDYRIAIKFYFMPRRGAAVRT
jgi:hypothetical protein